MEKAGIESVLKLQHCVFDRINFQRKGFKTNNQARFNLGVNIIRRDDHEYLVSLAVIGDKNEEYELSIQLSGYFRVEGDIDLTTEENLIKNNAVAILVPYVRSEISILTSQPETDAESLPIINVLGMVKCIMEL